MVELTQAMQQALIERIIKEGAAKGKMVEGGWRAFLLTSGLEKAPAMQQQEMRKAFYVGAQHVFGCILALPDDGPDDVSGLDSLVKEFDRFWQEIAREQT